MIQTSSNPQTTEGSDTSSYQLSNPVPTNTWAVCFLQCLKKPDSTKMLLSKWQPQILASLGQALAGAVQLFNLRYYNSSCNTKIFTGSK